MASCCTPTQGIDDFFSKHAERSLRQFRRKGLSREQRFLVEGIRSAGPEAKSVLEIGCGVGGLHLTLLKQGASAATGIDISQGMIRSARLLAAELGFERSTSYHVGDFVQKDGEVPEADIAVLDKVVCCYEEIDELLGRSLRKAKQIYALSFPRPTPLIKLMFKSFILAARLLGWSFHPWWHEWGVMLGTISAKGFTEIYRNNTPFWSVHVFRRSVT